MTLTETDFFPFAYPKIPGHADSPASQCMPLQQCIGFLKLDGTCLSAPWSREVGFGPISTRRHVVERDHPVFGEAYEILKELAPRLTAALECVPSLTPARFFFEFVGDHSFAGLHRAGEPKRLVLIDVAFNYAEGRISLVQPDLFLSIFGKADLGLDLPRVVYRGKFSGRVIEQIRLGKLLPAGAEGAVFKGGEGRVWLAKVKTVAWEERLKDTFKDGKWKAADAIERGVEEDSQ